MSSSEAAKLARTVGEAVAKDNGITQATLKQVGLLGRRLSQVPVVPI